MSAFLMGQLASRSAQLLDFFESRHGKLSL